MESLIKMIDKYKKISIVGMHKNSGKTTTLNYILNYYTEKKVGISSIGRDGEKKDEVTFTSKPRINPKENTIIATAEECLRNSKAEFVILHKTNFNTPLGYIYIVKIIKRGEIEIVGPSIVKHMNEIIEIMLKYKVDKIFIDGALHRKTFAVPGLSKGIILTVGAGYSKDMSEVIMDTEHIVKLLSIKNKLNEDDVEKARNFFKNNSVGIMKENEIIPTTKSCLLSNDNIGRIKDHETILIRGGVTDNLIEVLIKKLRGRVRLIVPDSTKIFINRKNFINITQSGGEIKVLNNVKVVLVTINPISPFGYNFDKDIFKNKLQEVLKIPVFNIME